MGTSISSPKMASIPILIILGKVCRLTLKAGFVGSIAIMFFNYDDNS